MEVVLPLPYYVLLVAEAAGLVALHLVHPEDSGGERYGYFLGWAGTVSMCVMHVYSLRRRVRALKHWGPLRAWLHFHIFMGLQGALFVSYHAAHLRTLWNFSGINITLVGVVVASGIFGRYLYAFIPKGLGGERLSAKQIEDELAAITADVQAGAPTPELARAVAEFAGGEKLHARLGFFQMIGEDVRARRAMRQLDAALAHAMGKRIDMDFATFDKLESFVSCARRRVLLARRLATFTVADRLFRNWTIAHKPLTFLLLGSTLLHVLGHYLYASSGMYGA
jgi:hypothetical protein